MKRVKVYVYPMAGDGIDNIATQQNPVDLETVGQHIERWLSLYQIQGYYSNAKMQRIPLGQLRFRLEFAGDAWKDQPKPELTPEQQAAWDKWHNMDQR